MNPWLSYFLGVFTPFALLALHLIGGLLIDAFTPTENYGYSRCVFCPWDSITRRARRRRRSGSGAAGWSTCT